MRQPIIIQYKNPESLFDGTLYYNGLVITAMQQMRQAYSKRKVKARVLDANMVLRILLPAWYQPLLGLQQFHVLSNSIDRLKAQYPDVPEINAFRNNMNDARMSIKTLAEIGITPDSLPKQNVEDRILRRLYQDMIEAQQSGIRAFQQEVDAWDDASVFADRLMTCEYRKTNEVIGVPKAVYFQGFYYITPLQLRLIHAFCQLDIPVYFLNAMDDQYPEAYAVWDQNPVFPKIAEKRILTHEAPLPAVDFSACRIRKFRDVFSMVCRMRSLNLQESALYAPLSTDVKELLETFFPDQEDKLHIFAYPIGRYLLSLYNMWDEDSNSFRLNPSDVRSAISTGWAGPEYQDGGKLLALYEKMQDYFQDCQTFEDWQQRLQVLHAVVHEVMPAFQEPAGNPELKRWRQIISHPFRSIGAFDCSDAEVQEITQVIQQMMKDAVFLFGDTGEVDLKKHFPSLKTLLQMKAKHHTVREEEKKVVAHLMERLDWNMSQNDSWPLQHLSNAMTLFLGGSLDEDDLSSGIEENKVGGVRGISDMESARFLHADKQIFLCCCDANNLPGHAKPYPWPLTSEVIASFVQTETAADAVRSRCQSYIHSMETTRLANRYLFHLAKQIPSIEFSWIEHQGNKDVNPSIYLTELARQYHLTIKEEQGLLVTEGPLASVQNGPWNLAEKTTPPKADKDGNIPIEWDFDIKTCSNSHWRWLYDYVLQDHPSFTERFQLSFLMTALIAITADIIPCSRQEAARQVFSIYPSFSESEKQEYTDFVGQTRQMERAPFDGKEYSLKRLYLEYLKIKAVNQFVADGSTNGNFCNWCPELKYCYVRRKEQINEH